MIETDRIYHMDCLEGMSLMADGSVDAIITDLPYGVLNRKNKAAEWDRREMLPPVLRAASTRLRAEARSSLCAPSTAIWYCS